MTPRWRLVTIVSVEDHFAPDHHDGGAAFRVLGSDRPRPCLSDHGPEYQAYSVAIARASVFPLALRACRPDPATFQIVFLGHLYPSNWKLTGADTGSFGCAQATNT
jgi:hypothetical protein